MLLSETASLVPGLTHRREPVGVVAELELRAVGRQRGAGPPSISEDPGLGLGSGRAGSRRSGRRPRRRRRSWWRTPAGRPSGSRDTPSGRRRTRTPLASAGAHRVGGPECEVAAGEAALRRLRDATAQDERDLLGGAHLPASWRSAPRSTCASFAQLQLHRPRLAGGPSVPTRTAPLGRLGAPRWPGAQRHLAGDGCATFATSDPHRQPAVALHRLDALDGQLELRRLRDRHGLRGRFRGRRGRGRRGRRRR